LKTHIHILQRDEDEEFIESTIINCDEIAEIQCKHPLPKKSVVDSDEKKEDVEIDDDLEPSEIEFLYKNGELRNIKTSTQTTFRLIDEIDGVIISTTNLQQFELGYLDIETESV